MRLFLALVGLLAVTTSVSAECAWVLWSGTLTDPINWYPLGAFTGRDECQERLELVRRSIGGLYKCLPDAIDAGGPKAK